MQTAAGRLSCTQPSSATECINPQATMGHKSRSAAILHGSENDPIRPAVRPSTKCHPFFRCFQLRRSISSSRRIPRLVGSLSGPSPVAANSVDTASISCSASASVRRQVPSAPCRRAESIPCFRATSRSKAAIGSSRRRSIFPTGPRLALVPARAYRPHPASTS